MTMFTVDKPGAGIGEGVGIGFGVCLGMGSG